MQSVKVFWARLASFGQLDLISHHLIVSKFHNGLHDPKRRNNLSYIEGQGDDFTATTQPHSPAVVKSTSKVKKAAKISNRYNQVPRLNQYSTGK